jgi:SAM-dependent methyltransferase
MVDPDQFQMQEARMSNKSVRSDGVKARFETEGPSWSERAYAGELGAVLAPLGSERGNRFLHSISLHAAKVALSLMPQAAVLVDFGCGTGRFVRFFGARGYYVIGTEITSEMLSAAQQFGLPKRSTLVLNDGVTIPLKDESVDLVWVCGVLKYSLFIPNPVYQDIAKEMHRVLKPGGYVVNSEMYVEAQPEVFISDFEKAGFITRKVRLLRREGLLEAYSMSPLVPTKCIGISGKLCASLRFRFADPWRVIGGLRDYLFVWSKPVSSGGTEAL